MKTNLKLTLVALAAASLTACGGGGAASGPTVETGAPDLPFGADLGFGLNGYVSPNFTRTHDALTTTQSYDIFEVMADQMGRVTIVGRFTNSGNGDQRAYVARFAADGAPDATCGAGGLTELFTHGVGETLGKIKAAPGGGYVALISNSERRLARITENCALDTTFGTSGFAWANSRTNFVDMDVAADGSVVLLSERGIVRIKVDGTQDLDFGDGGVASFAYPLTATTHLTSVRVREDGRVLVGGRIEYGGSQVVTHNFGFVAQLTADGQLDTSFGQGGFATTQSSFVVDGQRVDPTLALTSDGGAVLAWGGRKRLADDTAPTDVSVLFKVDGRGVVASGFGFGGQVEWVHKGLHTLNHRVSVDGAQVISCGAIGESMAPSLSAAYVLDVSATTGEIARAVMFFDKDANPTVGSTYKTCLSVAAANGRTYAALWGVGAKQVITRVKR